MQALRGDDGGMRNTTWPESHKEKTERNAEIIRLFRQGMSHKELAKKFGVSRSAISRLTMLGGRNGFQETHP
jgi:transposase